MPLLNWLVETRRPCINMQTPHNNALGVIGPLALIVVEADSFAGWILVALLSAPRASECPQPACHL
jgi:hypothetical protein